MTTAATLQVTTADDTLRRRITDDSIISREHTMILAKHIEENVDNLD